MGARAIQEINDKVNGTNWREGNGRPTAEQTVKEWQQAYPEGRKADCIRETGLSKPTVYNGGTKGSNVTSLLVKVMGGNHGNAIMAQKLRHLPHGYLVVSDPSLIIPANISVFFGNLSHRAG